MDYYSPQDNMHNMSLYNLRIPEKGKKIHLYRNGTEVPAKTFVVNSRNVKDFNSFLNQVTSCVDAREAIRTIYTPCEGHKVKDLIGLKDGAHYVVGGKEPFKQVKYGRNLSRKVVTLRKSLDTTLITLPPLPPLLKHISAQAKFLEPVAKPVCIVVYRNGEVLHKGAKILLSQKELHSWDKVLEIVTEKVGLYLPGRRMYTTDGKRIRNTNEFENLGRYVVVEPNKRFKKVVYGANDLMKTSLTRPSGSHPLVYRVKRLSYRPNVMSEASMTTVAIKDHSMALPAQLVPLKPASERVRKISVPRPLGGRRNKENREIEKFLVKVNEDPAFAPSTATLPQTEKQAASPDDTDSLLYPLQDEVASYGYNTNNIHLVGPNEPAQLHTKTLTPAIPLGEGEVEDAPGLVSDKPVDFLPTEEVPEQELKLQKTSATSNPKEGNQNLFTFKIADLTTPIITNDSLETISPQVESFESSSAQVIRLPNSITSNNEEINNLTQRKSSKEANRSKTSSKTNLRQQTNANLSLIEQLELSPVDVRDTTLTNGHIEDSMLNDARDVADESFAIEESKDVTFDKSDVSNTEEVVVADSNGDYNGISNLNDAENGETIINDVKKEKQTTPSKRKSAGKFIDEDSSRENKNADSNFN